MRQLYALLAVCLLIAASGRAETITIHSTFTDVDLNTTEANGAIWNLTHTSGTLAFYQYGIKNGTNEVGFGTVTLTTKSSYTDVKSVTLCTCLNKDKSATISMKVGDTPLSYGTATTATCNTYAPTDYTFTGDASGVVTVTITSTDKTAVYIKGLALTYEGTATSVEPVEPETATGTVALVATKNGITYAAHNTIISGSYKYFKADAVAVHNGLVCVDDREPYRWTLTDKGNDEITLQDPTGKYLAHTGTSTDAQLTTTPTTLTVQDGRYYDDTRYLAYSNPAGVAYMKFFDASQTATPYVAMPFADHFRVKPSEVDYGTICLPYAVKADAHAGATFYRITNIDGGHLTLTEETGDLVAGQPYIFEFTGDALTCVYTGEAVSAPLTDTYLTGTFEPLAAVPTGVFVLQKQDGVLGFYKVEDTQPSLAAYRCYLQVPGSQAKAFTLGTATAIATPLATRPDATYNLAGQRVTRPTHGLYIQGGKKVVR